MLIVVCTWHGETQLLPNWTPSCDYSVPVSSHCWAPYCYGVPNWSTRLCRLLVSRTTTSIRWGFATAFSGVCQQSSKRPSRTVCHKVDGNVSAFLTVPWIALYFRFCFSWYLIIATYYVLSYLPVYVISVYYTYCHRIYSYAYAGRPEVFMNCSSETNYKARCKFHHDNGQRLIFSGNFAKK